MSTHERPTQRSACDRCHGQKLRCIRGTAGPNDRCQRCIKAREVCQYSPPLRLGRRGIRLLTGNAEGDGAVSSRTSSQNESTMGDRLEQQSEEIVLVSSPQSGLSERDVGDMFLPSLDVAQDFMWDFEQINDEYDNTIFTADASIFPATFEPSPPARPQHDVQLSSRDLELLKVATTDNNTPTMQDWISGHESKVSEVAGIFNDKLDGLWKTQSMNMSCGEQNTGSRTTAQPSAPNNVVRQLIKLLESLYADANHNPMSPSSSDPSNLNHHFMDVTVKAAHTLANVINSLQKSKPAAELTVNNNCSSNTDTTDAEAGYLLAACYSRIFHNTNMLAISLHKAVSSKDMSALRSMPNITIGSATPICTPSPVIQTSLWVQLLWQSVRELEKGLLALSNSNSLTPPRPETSLGPRQRSHVHGIVKDIDADVAKLEINVDYLLQTTLHTLHHGSI